MRRPNTAVAGNGKAQYELYVAIKATSPSALPSEKQIVGELLERASALPGSVGSFINSLDKRRTKIATMFEAGVLEERVHVRFHERWSAGNFAGAPPSSVATRALWLAHTNVRDRARSC